MVKPGQKRGPQIGVSRREWLERMGLVAGATALVGHLPGCDSEAGAESDSDASGALDAGPDASAPVEDAGAPDGDPDVGPEPAPDLVPLRGDGSHPFHYIDTLVIVQMENRSFDQFFGALSLLEGRDDIDGLRADMSNPGPGGARVGPVPLAPNWAVSPDPPHGRGACLRQWNEGANDGFVAEWQQRLGDPARLPWIMGYYAREDLPTSYALADAFTLCQSWHCSLLTSTWPNRFFSHCASSDGRWANDGTCAAPTPYPALVAAGYSHRTYFHNLFFTLTITSLPEKNTRKTDQFFVDAAAGALANVNIVEPAFFLNDDHPPADVRMGQAFVASVYEALRQSPHWPRCLMLVFYDEHGGFFDHKPPPKAEGEARAAEGFDQLGFRVPALVIGPLARRGFVLDSVIDHSSVPSLISNLFQVDHVNERSRLAGDLGAALDIRLVRGADRPPPPAVQPVRVSMDMLERALYADAGQPELQEWMRKMGLAHHDSLPERRRVMRRFLQHAQRLGTMTFD